MERILVLGGTGFLGRHVLRLARAAGYDAVSLSRREGCDLTNLDSFHNHLREIRPTAVINCAAHVGSVQYALRKSATMFADNMQQLLNLYCGVAEVCPTTRIINPISNCSYPGDADVQRESEWRDGPVHDSVLAYGSHRQMIYVLSECYRREHGVSSVNWLIANAYGPGDQLDPDKVHALNGIIIRLIRAQRAGERTFEIWGSGRPIREWVYIEDVARILVASLSGPEQIMPLNFAQNRGWSIAEIAAVAAEALEFNVEFTFNTRLADGAPVKILDDTLFRRTHADFVFTPLAAGIPATIDYYRNTLPAEPVFATA